MSIVAEPEAKASAGKSNWRVAPVTSQPPSSEQMRLGWPEERRAGAFCRRWRLAHRNPSRSHRGGDEAVGRAGVGTGGAHDE